MITNEGHKRIEAAESDLPQSQVLAFDCGHKLLVPIDHNLWDHSHFCPVCKPGQTTCEFYEPLTNEQS